MNPQQQAALGPPDRTGTSVAHFDMGAILSAGRSDDTDGKKTNSPISSEPQPSAALNRVPLQVAEPSDEPAIDATKPSVLPNDAGTDATTGAEDNAAASTDVDAMSDFWRDFGLIAHGDYIYALPPGVVGFETSGDQQHPILIELLKTMTVPPRAKLDLGERRLALYRLANPELLPAMARNVPNGVTLVRDGDRIALGPIEPGVTTAQRVDQLSELTMDDIVALGRSKIDPAVTSNPLLRFSLQGQSEKFRLMAVEAHPLLGEVCLRGQVTIWYAAPNTGKTLIALNLVRNAVADGRINPHNVFYVNADDNGAGFASKIQLMDDLGAHVLAPGFRGLERAEMITHLQRMAEADEARGVLIILDTLKKFADLMDKKHSSAIAQAFRLVAMKGGTVLALAHTTKNSNNDGTPRYAGTTDIVEDADAAYTISPLSGTGNAREKVVEFRCIKARGASAERAAYAFAAEKDILYEELLASVRLVDPDEADEFKRVEEERSDGDLIEAVKACIAEGINTKMLLVKEAAKRSRASERAVIRLIKRYTGDDPAQHRWNFVRREHGAQVFEPLPG